MLDRSPMEMMSPSQHVLLGDSSYVVLGLAEMLSVVSLHCKIYRVSLCNGNHLMDDFFGMLYETIAHEKFPF